jgi:predicted O-linked N-acetylglucosamine transferase (SPINDLY family)
MDPRSGFQLAVAHYRQGQLDRAESQCRAALKGQPRNVAGLHLFAMIQFRKGQADDAIATFDRLLRLQPARPDALNHRGVALLQGQRFEDALTSFDGALRLKPDYAEALNNRSTALKDLGRFDEALEAIDRTLAISPKSAAALCNRGAILRSLDRPEEALACFDQALALEPLSPVALNFRARLLYFFKRHAEASETFKKLLKVDPNRPFLRGLIFELKLGACDWTDFDATVADISARVDRGEPVEHPLNFAWYSLSAASQARCTEIFAASEWPTPKRLLPPPPRYKHDRIRLAYFSPDFREHPISYMFAGLIERHDRRRFEVTAVSYGASDGSTMRARLERIFDRFTDARTMVDLKVAQLIRQHEIDIVVDLAGFTASNRGAVLAYRPAPIVVNFQGFGTAAPFIDYVIADRQTVPDHLKAFYREKVVRMPDSWVVTDDAERIAEVAPTRSDLGLPEQGFVFCAFNGANKIMPMMFDVWMRLLRAVEGSVLWLRYDNDQACANLRTEAERRGIAGHRLVFARRIGLPEHLARHQHAGLFLDTYPYGAHTTASHALWAGLPVPTMRGESFVSRVGASLLSAIGLPELIVESLADYEALALKLARDPELLAGLRQRLMRARLTAPLFDSDRYVRHIESAYATMVERHRSGLAPASFDVVEI